MNVSQKYSQNEINSLEQSELESRALIRTAAALNNIKQNWEEKKGELDEALNKNRRLWVILSSAISEGDSPQPEEVKKNILNLALFVFKRTIDVLSNPRPEGLDILITINMNIARGLGEHNAPPPATATPEAEPPK